MGCASSIHISDRVVYHSGKEAEDSHSPPQSNTHPGLPVKPSNKVRGRGPRPAGVPWPVCVCELAGLPVSGGDGGGTGVFLMLCVFAGDGQVCAGV